MPWHANGVLADVQGSTSLYEQLPAQVMDEAMVLHDACMRKAMRMHDGYEAGNEGE